MAKRAINFSKMAVAELVQLRDAVEAALNGRIAVERKELQSKMDALAAFEHARSSGSRVARGKTPGRGRKVHPLKGRKAPPKYQGPDGETWAGRGLTPRWMTALEKKGQKRESFLIQP